MRLIKSLKQPSNLFFTGFMLAVLYAPVILIWLNIIPFAYRFHASGLLLITTIIYILLQRHNLSDLGFRTDNLKESLFWNLLLCLIGSSAIYILYGMGILKHAKLPFLPVFYITYFLILGPLQELFFRSILFAEMKKLKIRNRSILTILLSATTFCFLHIIYAHPPVLVITLISGILWGIVYHRYPNFWGVSLSHSLLGSIAIACGLLNR